MCTKPLNVGAANAVLIAAAPLMYEALQAIIGAADHGDLEGGQETSEAVDRVRAALAAATGEQS